MFGDLSTPSFANLHIYNVKFVQCDIVLYKYHHFGNTNESLVFLVCLVQPQ